MCVFQIMTNGGSFIIFIYVLYIPICLFYYDLYCVMQLVFAVYFDLIIAVYLDVIFVVYFDMKFYVLKIMTNVGSFIMDWNMQTFMMDIHLHKLPSIIKVSIFQFIKKSVLIQEVPYDPLHPPHIPMFFAMNRCL